MTENEKGPEQVPAQEEVQQQSEPKASIRKGFVLSESDSGDINLQPLDDTIAPNLLDVIGLIARAQAVLLSKLITQEMVSTSSMIKQKMMEQAQLEAVRKQLKLQ